MLRVTERPITTEEHSFSLLRRLHSDADADAETTYYICGRCGIITGKTPELLLSSETVVACQSCGAHNELPSPAAWLGRDWGIQT